MITTLHLYTSDPTDRQTQAWAEQYTVRDAPVVVLPLSQLPQVRFALPATRVSSPALCPPPDER